MDCITICEKIKFDNHMFVLFDAEAVLALIFIVIVEKLMVQTTTFIKHRGYNHSSP